MSHSQPAGQQLSVSDLPVVMEELNDIRTKWYDIGLQLRISVGTLDAIKEQYDDPSHCLREALKTWLKTCPSHPTWNNIIDALRSSTVGEVRLAADLEQMYSSTQDTHNCAPPVPPSKAHTTVPPQSTIPPTQPPVFAYSVTQPSHSSPWSTPYYYSPHTGYSLSTLLPLTPPTVATTSVHPSCSQLSQVTPTSSSPLLPSPPTQLTTPQRLPDEFQSVTSSEKIKLLGKHLANTQAETPSSKRQRNLHTSDMPQFGWNPATSGAATTFVYSSHSQLSQVTCTSSCPLLPSVSAQPTTPQFQTGFSQFTYLPSLISVPPDTSPIQPPVTVTTPTDLPPPVTTHTLGIKLLYVKSNSN